MSIGVAVYSICNANAGVVALIGDGAGNVRLYPGNAPQPDGGPQLNDFAVMMTVSGAPANTLDRRAPADNEVIQFNCYSRDKDRADAIAEAIRAAFEDDAACVTQKLGAVIDRFIGKDFEDTTQMYFNMFSISFWLAR